MRIAWDFHTNNGNYLPASDSFIKMMIVEMARKHVNHAFIFLAADPVRNTGDLPDNISIHYVNKFFLKWLGKKLWHRYLLPKILLKLQADLFITIDNLYFQKTSIPTCLFLMHQCERLHGESPIVKTGKSDRMLTNAVRNASTVITFSYIDKRNIEARLSSPQTNIKLILPQPAEIPELVWTEKEMAKIDFAAGVEYFVFVGDLHPRYDLVGLLKAFALFKKWQQSNMQLVIAGNKSSWTMEFSDKLSSFKYRREVNVIINPSNEKIQKIIGGAYAFIYPAVYDHFPISVLKAMRAGVPVISTPIPVCKEWCGNSILYPETSDAAGFAKAMQLMYRDEQQRSDFIFAAKTRLSDNLKNDPAETCLNFFEETIAK